MTLANVRTELSMKSLGGIAGDRLDLVAQPVHRPIAVARAAIQGTGDVVHHRAQQRLVGAQARGAQSRRDAGHQDLGLERHAHHVVGSGVERSTQLIGRIQRGRHDDVGRGQFGLAREPPASVTAADGAPAITTGIGTSGQRAQGAGDVIRPLEADPGVHQHGPAVVMKLLQADAATRVAAFAPVPLSARAGSRRSLAPSMRSIWIATPCPECQTWPAQPTGWRSTWPPVPMRRLAQRDPGRM